MENGGERYEYISALNAEPDHIDALTELVNTHLQGWSVEEVNEQRQELANKVEKQTLPYSERTIKVAGGNSFGKPFMFIAVGAGNCSISLVFKTS